MVLRQGDIVSVSFDPTRGREPAKTRPALVVSCESFNLRSSLVAACPITSTDNGYPLHIPVAGTQKVQGFVCIEQLRTLDLVARHAEVIDRADAATMATVMGCVAAVFSL